MEDLQVPINRIVPLTDTRDNFSRIVTDIENDSEGLYVLTKGGKPSIALISIKYLETLIHAGRITGAAPVKEPEKKDFKSDYIRPIVKPIINTMREDKPLPPKMPEIPPKPFTAPPMTVPKIEDQPPKIDPSWTGSKPADDQPSTTPTPPPPPPVKPASPWPLASDSKIDNTPDDNKSSSVPGITRFDEPAGIDLPKDEPIKPPILPPPIPPKPSTLPPPIPPKPPVFEPPAPLSTPVLPPATGPQSVKVNVTNPIDNRPASLPPPPANPNTIAFDAPPKIDGEGASASKPITPPAPPTPPTVNPTQPVSNPIPQNNPTTTASVKDLDI